MDVVATHAGKYGVMRERGDEFTLEAKSAFSTRWMVKAGTPEAREILAERHSVGLTDGQISAEEARATGRSSKAADAALRAAEKRVAELEAQVESLQAAARDTTDAPEDTSDADDEPAEDAGDEGDDTADPPSAERVTRRRRT